MKKSLLILTALLSISSSAFAENFPPTYKKALSGLDILEAELQGSFLSVTFNRDEIGKQMLESVVRGICFETYLDKKFAKKLKNNRFAIVTISDVRDKKGFYRDLTGVTKRAFESAGVMFYNDIVLINVIGSGALRA